MTIPLDAANINALAEIRPYGESPGNRIGYPPASGGFFLPIRAGSPSAGFMLRKGQWKYHHYIGYAPELFDLDNDREELYDLASSPEHSDVLAMMESELRKICDPDIVNQAAKADQAKLIERHGGRENALFVGAPAATPVPGASAKFGN